MNDDQTTNTNPQDQTDEQVTEPSALPEDNGTPLNPDEEQSPLLDEAHSATDSQSDADSTQAADEGVDEASQA